MVRSNAFTGELKSTELKMVSVKSGKIMFMETLELTPEPDGTIKINGVLNERQIKALESLNIALRKLSYAEMLTDPPETWLDYWFDREQISEDDLRSEIQSTLSSSA